ncbi:MAG: hypothetical protein GY789_06795 [Hyphomicrobiales bacterium]|nr:hypothetical protein [Hyphomicrobiales bacterium]MCP5000985.1 hypothetical protein [Hyphomicrobiales bacterium]
MLLQQREAIHVRFIGDVHGKFEQYVSLIEGVDASIQVGDMGLGFFAPSPDGVTAPPEPRFDVMRREGNHRFIRGNQDDPTACAQHCLCIADGHSEGDMFFCGGALSVNLKDRTKGLNWWPDEELSEPELARIREKYLDERQPIMVTHDCPHAIAKAILSHNNIDKGVAISRTRQAFQRMWEQYKPQIWVFGHWHMSMDALISGTRFICLAELEPIDI